MTTKRLITICLIVGWTSAAWFLLAGTVQFRSNNSDSRLGSEVAKVWGPVLTQQHPALFYESPTSANAVRATFLFRRAVPYGSPSRSVA